MCVACYVDEATKGKIIAYSAKFHEVTRGPYGGDKRVLRGGGTHRGEVTN